jgi:hypothetical protein
LIKNRTTALNRGKTLTLTLLRQQNHQHLKLIETQIAVIDGERSTILAANATLKAVRHPGQHAWLRCHHRCRPAGRDA